MMSPWCCTPLSFVEVGGTGKVPSCAGANKTWDFVGYQIDPESGDKKRPDWWKELLPKDALCHEEAFLRYFGSMVSASKEHWEDLPVQLVGMEHPRPHPILAADFFFTIRSLFWPDEVGWGEVGCVSIRTFLIVGIENVCYFSRRNECGAPYLREMAATTVQAKLSMLHLPIMQALQINEADLLPLQMFCHDVLQACLR